jgi:hypothetical protein
VRGQGRFLSRPRTDARGDNDAHLQSGAMERRENFRDKSVERFESGNGERSAIQVHTLRAVFLDQAQ